MDKGEFADSIISYYREEGRDFPWRSTNNDFHAIVAEVMLQKTTADQVEEAYQEFVKRYPNPEDVQKANIEIFEDIGLLKRSEYVKNIAEFLLSDKKINRENLLEVKGLGRYTVNAFLSIHKSKTLPIVDANVARVFNHFFEVEDDSPPYANEELWRLAEELLPQKNVREYNLGLLDKGASLREKGFP